MGLLIAAVVIAIGALAIGVGGGIHAARTQQWLPAIAATVGSYYLLVGGAWAFFLMETDNRSLQAFLEAFWALAKSLLLLGLVPLLIAFGISAALAR